MLYNIVGWTNISLLAGVSNNHEAVLDVATLESAGLKSGGRYEPKECISMHKIAIIVPYRNRIEHLTLFLRYMHPFLQRQQLNYTIFIVEQSESKILHHLR
jgi:hypothetical protein